MSWSELYCRGVAPVQPTGWLFSCAAISRMICTFDEHQFAGQLRAFEAQFNAGNVSNVHPRPVRQNTLGSCAILDTPLAEVSEDEIDHRDHVAAPFEFVFHDVGQAVFDGRIGTAFRDKKGGELFLVPVAWWGIDDFWHRFATGGINPLQPYDCDAEQTHWLYFHEKSWLQFHDNYRQYWGLSLQHTRHIEHYDDSSVKVAQPWVGSHSVEVPISRGRGGRRPVREWPAFAAALAEWVHLRDDDAEGIAGRGPDTILNEVFEILAERGCDTLERSTFQPATQELVKRMRERALIA